MQIEASFICSLLEFSLRAFFFLGWRFRYDDRSRLFLPWVAIWFHCSVFRLLICLLITGLVFFWCFFENLVWWCLCFGVLLYLCARLNGELAQLARAPALQAGGHRFDSDILHKMRKTNNCVSFPHFFYTFGEVNSKY